MAAKSGVGIEIREERGPVTSDVTATGEMLGLDPFQIGNEGVAVLGEAPTTAETVVVELRDRPTVKSAAPFGKPIAVHLGRVQIDAGFCNCHPRARQGTSPAALLSQLDPYHRQSNNTSVCKIVYER